MVKSIISSGRQAESETSGCINIVWSYQECLLVLLRHLIVYKLLSCCEKVLRIVVVPFLLSCSCPNAVYQCYYPKYRVTVLNFILLKYLVDDGCVHPPLVNFSYERACQSALLIMDIYKYICCRSTSPIDKLIICQNAREKRFSYII